MFKKSVYKPWKGYLILAVMVVAAALGAFQKWQNKDEMPVLDVILTPQTCSDAGGVWNECGSACRGNDEDACIEVCVAYCECTQLNDCPFGHSCINPINGIGICSK